MALYLPEEMVHHPRYPRRDRNLDGYQLNCTYYSALGNDDDLYLLARAVQFFCPGIPPIYDVEFLAGENDIELLKRTRVGRNINRHNYSPEEVEENLKRDVVRRLFDLMRFRNSHPAFSGTFQLLESYRLDPQDKMVQGHPLGVPGSRFPASYFSDRCFGLNPISPSSV